MKEMLNLKNPKIYAEMFLSRMPKNAKRILMYGISDKRTIEIILDSFPKAKFVIADREANFRLLRHFYSDKNKFTYINTSDDEKDLTLFNEEGEIWKMPKFDVAIMNPPYGDSLHLEIFDMISNHCNTVCVFPFTWCAKQNINLPKGQWREKLQGKIDSVIYYEHRIANDTFGTGNSIEDLAVVSTKPNTKFDLIHYGFKNRKEYNLYKKIDFYAKEGCKTMSSAKSKSGEFGGTAEMFRTMKPKFYVPIYQWHGGKNCFDACVIQDEEKIKKGCSYFKFNSENEKYNFLKSLDTTFMDWFYFTFIEPGDNKEQAYLFRMVDYSKPWTNKRFCKFFGITGFISNTEAEPGSEWETILKTTEVRKNGNN